jgi:hypothetical protein
MSETNIPSEIKEKIDGEAEALCQCGMTIIQCANKRHFKQGAEYGYQLATDGREQSKTDFDRTTFPAQGQKPFGYDEKKEAEELAYILRERPTNDGREELEKENEKLIKVIVELTQKQISENMKKEEITAQLQADLEAVILRDKLNFEAAELLNKENETLKDEIFKLTSNIKPNE